MSSLSVRRFITGLACLALAIPVVGEPSASACPFCSAVSLTFTEEMAASDLVVIARVTERPENAQQPTANPAESLSTFQITRVIKGEQLAEGDSLKAFYFGDNPGEKEFLLMGIGETDTAWSTPIELTERSVEYLCKLPELPPSGAERLVFFQEYLEDPEDLLVRDAYDEFAKAPYAEVVELKDQMYHDKLLTWIQDPKVLTSHRRLYLTMMGVCGTPDDVPVLEGMITSDDREAKAALDALIACYLTLHGPDGMELIEEKFLANPDAEYTDTYSAIMALRFHGQEEDVIPKERLLAGMRHMLDRPELADLVIPDLARWEDWSAMERLVELFKNADDQSAWVRVPVINYLRVCPLPEAKEQIAELAKIDPDAVQRANSFFPLDGGTDDATEELADGEIPATDGETPATEEAAAAEEIAEVDQTEAPSLSVDDVAVVEEATEEAEPMEPAPAAEGVSAETRAAVLKAAGDIRRGTAAQIPVEMEVVAQETEQGDPAAEELAEADAEDDADEGGAAGSVAARPGGDRRPEAATPAVAVVDPANRWLVYAVPAVACLGLFVVLMFILRSGRREVSAS